MILEHVACIELLHIHLDMYQNDRRGNHILTVVCDDVISNANILPKSISVIMWISDWNSKARDIQVRKILGLTRLLIFHIIHI